MDNIFLLLFFVSFVALIVGLIKPTVFSRFTKGEITRKKIATIFGIATVAAFILFGITTDRTKKYQVPQQPTTKNTEESAGNENQNSAPADIDKSPTPAKTENTPASTQAKQTGDQNIPPVSSETISQKNAVKKAISYLGYSAFSHDGLVAQLEYEQFSHADAVYGADNSGANWNEQAAKKAKQYMEYSAFSRGSLIEQLKYDKFTQGQAEYGANAVGL